MIIPSVAGKLQQLIRLPPLTDIHEWLATNCKEKDRGEREREEERGREGEKERERERGREGGRERERGGGREGGREGERGG